MYFASSFDPIREPLYKKRIVPFGHRPFLGAGDCVKAPTKKFVHFYCASLSEHMPGWLVAKKAWRGGGAQSALYKGASLRNLGHRHIWNLKHINDVDPVENRVTLIVGPPPRLTSF